MTPFGPRLRALRLARGVTQWWLAREAGCTRAYLGALESGRHDPTAALLARLADVLGLTMDELYLGLGRCEGVGT